MREMGDEYEFAVLIGINHINLYILHRFIVIFVTLGML